MVMVIIIFIFIYCIDFLKDLKLLNYKGLAAILYSLKIIVVYYFCVIPGKLSYFISVLRIKLCR